MKLTAVRNLSGKIQVINGRSYAPGDLVPVEDSILADGRVLPTLGPPPDTRRIANRGGG